MPIIAALVAFALGSGSVYIVVGKRARQEQRRRDRWAQVAGQAATPAAPESDTETVSTDSAPIVTHWIQDRAFGRRVQNELVRAGWRLRPSEFLALCAASTLIAFLAGSLLLPLLGALLLGGLAWSVPWLLLRQRQARRYALFETQLPDALTLIASSLRAGYSLQRALQMVADEMPLPIAEEFGWALGEIHWGAAVDAALGRIVGRIRSNDLDLAVTAIALQRQVGGNLAELLDTVSQTIRERAQLQGEVQALTAEGRLSGVILLVLPFVVAFGLAVRDPEYFQPLLQSPIGLPLIAGAVAAQILGGLIIRRMVALDR